MTSSPSPPTTTLSPCRHFFNLPELVASLLSHLDRSSIARLTQTCRHLNIICTPALYISLSFTGSCPEFDLLESRSSIYILARNLRHVRRVSFGNMVAAYYYNCLRTFLEYDNDSSGIKPSLPVWFPRMDESSATSKANEVSFVPLPPMIHLTSYTSKLESGTCDEIFSLIYLQYCTVVQLRMRQDMAILHYCPQLTTLYLDLLIQSDIDIHLLSLTLRGLPSLKSLTLKGMMSEKEWPTLVPLAFFSCSEMLVDFRVRFIHDDGIFAERPEWSEEDFFDDGELEEVREALLPAVQEKDLPPIPHRQQPLQHLTTFFVNAMDTLTQVQIQSIFEHCPGLVSLVIPQLHPVINIRSLAHFIAEHCPRIQKIDHKRSDTDNQLAFDLMAFLPPDTVQDLTIIRFDKDWEELVPIMGRHKGSLRKVDFVGCCRFISAKVKEEVFGQCLGLEALHLDIDPYTAVI
ncbi:hypothetical protein F5H01DRAFT_370409 [Linnemannia elongata]|nr:hypothetical protein F5H01DRAFT_370409 [Linnemannia elongata]